MPARAQAEVPVVPAATADPSLGYETAGAGSRHRNYGAASKTVAVRPLLGSLGPSELTYRKPWKRRRATKVSQTYSLRVAGRRAEVATDVRLVPRVKPGIPPVVLGRIKS